MTKKYRSRRYKNPRLNIAFLTVVVLVVVGALFNVADILSSLIVGKGSIFYNNSFESPAKTFYAISCGAFSDENRANQLAQNVKAKGGAGYVYLSGEYYVFLSMYASQLDAKSVQEKLKQEDVKASIVNINIPKLKLTLTQKDEVCIKLAKEFLSLFDFLYELSLEYDSGSMDYGQCIKKINDREKSLDYVSAYEPTKKEGITIKEKIVKIKQSLKALSLSLKDNNELNSAIKQTYFEIIFEYISLCKDMS